MAYKILYADDEENYRKLVKMFLQRAGYEVFTACDGEEALECLKKVKDIDLVILDILMPGFDGHETCQRIRSFSEIPIIMLTALGDERNEITGIELGADDYITKPFSNEVLTARIGALLRRTKKHLESVYQQEGVTFFEVSNSVQIGENTFSLTPKEFELLKCLVQGKNRILSRDQILDRVWGFDYFGDFRTVDTHIKSLRAKIGDEGSRIKTIRNKGYSYQGRKE